MRPGDLNQRVWIQRPVQRRTDTGSAIEDYEDWFPTWAAIEPLSPREVFAAQMVQSDITARIRIYYRPNLSAKLRIRHQRQAGSPSVNDFYDVEGPPLDIKAAKREIHFLCRRRDAEGFRTGAR